MCVYGAMPEGAAVDTERKWEVSVLKFVYFYWFTEGSPAA